jgi:hypothetical protein
MQRLERQSSPEEHGSTEEVFRVQQGSPALPQLWQFPSTDVELPRQVVRGAPHH